jgi:hypothetical protein
MDQFPPNSRKSVEPPKRVERVTSAEAIRRRKPLGRQFKNTFIGGDAKTALGYVMANIVLPSARDMLSEFGTNFWDHLIYGSSKRARSGPTSGPLGYVSYNRMNQGASPSRHPGMPQTVSRQARARQSFDDIVIPSRQEAEEVLDRLYDLVSKYESATVADLYELVGLVSAHTDHKWGWEDLHGASVGRVRGGGYLLNLPEPQSLE